MQLIDYKNGIYAFDADYYRPGMAAIHLLESQGQVAFIDTGTQATVPHALAALEQLGLTADAVRYVILTHIHLDHAGGAGQMMQAFSNARLVVHPRGARHMADPRQLLAGVKAVYGAEQTQQLYGDLLPIAQQRIIAVAHGQILQLGDKELICIDLPGHARHHIGIVDNLAKGVFTGDTFGISYREQDMAGEPFVFPSTTPVQFDPVAMHASIELVRSYQPEAVYLTHYSRLGNVDILAERLHRLLDAQVAIAESEHANKTQRAERIQARLTELLLAEARQHGSPLSDEELCTLWAVDLELNAQGLDSWLEARDAGHAERLILRRS